MRFILLQKGEIVVETRLSLGVFLKHADFACHSERSEESETV